MSEAKATLLQVINPPIYLVSILPGIAVLLFNPDSNATTSVIWATFAVVLIQHAINLFNDVTDWQRGADPDKFLSWVRFTDGKTRGLEIQAFISLICGGLLGILILYLENKSHVLLLATPLVLAGYLYNKGRVPLSYTHLGEWVTGICYGGVFACLWWLSTDRDGTSELITGLIGSISYAALAGSILLSHQPLQIQTDSAAGKISFAVRHGKQKTWLISRLLYGLFCLTTIMLFSQVSTSLTRQLCLLGVCSATIVYTLRTEPCPAKVLIPASMCILCCL